MNNLRRYIFQQDIISKYSETFNNYVIDKIYGSNILIGSEIEDEYKDK